MLREFLYLILFFSVILLFIICKKIYRRHIDNKLLEGIDEKTKKKIIENQKISLIDKKNEHGYLIKNFLEISKPCGFWFILGCVIFIFFIISGFNENDILLLVIALLLPPVIILLFFLIKDLLRFYSCKKRYIINAYCLDVRFLSTQYGSSKEASIIYFDYKQCKLVIKSIILNIGNDFLSNNSFCYIIVGERKKYLTLIDVFATNKCEDK
ncbi:MAG: hypothetical protein E7271_05375 [Lachnospiraceae bacterium]|jgi:hypothetical protein|nr:hypothetical protein [Lachnospiraceae bacterium]